MILYGLMDRVVPPPPPPSSVLFYYYGTGFDNKANPGTNDATEVGTVPQPSSPTPPAGGTGWLFKGNSGYLTDYINIPFSPWNGLAEGCLEFYYRIDSANPDTPLWMVGHGPFSGSDNDNFYALTYGGTVYMQRTIPPANQNVTAFFPVPTYDVTHLWRIEFGSFGLRVYIDSILVASDLSQPFQAGGTYSTWDMGTIGNTIDNGPFPWTDSGIDGFMLSSDPNQVYPPV